MIKPASYWVLHKHADALIIGRVGVALAGRRYFVPLLFTGRGFGVWWGEWSLYSAKAVYGRIAILRRIVYTTIYFVEYRRCI